LSNNKLWHLRAGSFGCSSSRGLKILLYKSL